MKNKNLRNNSTYKNIIKQLFKYNKVKTSWTRIIFAAICSAVPIIIGFALNEPKYGMWGSLGGFTYLYTVNEPYVQRIKKMFLIAISITFCAALGLVVAGHPWSIIIIAGVIGAVSTFIFGILKMPGPAALFYIMLFTMTSSIKLDKNDIYIFTLIILASSLFAWIMSMLGYFIKPHGPELQKVTKLFYDLAELSKNIGKTNVNPLRSKLVNSLKETETILLSGYSKRKNSVAFCKLYLLNQYANKLFLELLEIDHSKPIPEEILNILDELQDQMELGTEKKISLSKIEKGKYKEYDGFLTIIYDIEAIINTDLEYIGDELKLSKPSSLTLMIESINFKSVLFVSSVRYGIIILVAAFVAHILNLPKAYWIPMTCAAVMGGLTVVATFYRAIQRSIGTIIGVFIAMGISYLNPHGYYIALINIVLVILMQLFLTKNYALATVFITPNAILIAGTAAAGAHSVFYFAEARIINIIIGSMIGLIGTYLIGRKSGSRRLRELMAGTMHNQARVIFALSKCTDEKIDMLKERMEIHYNNFKLAYHTALSEKISSNARLDVMWPAVYSVENINYLLCQRCSEKDRIRLSDEQLGKVISTVEILANEIELDLEIDSKRIEVYNSIPVLSREINTLLESLTIAKNKMMHEI